MKFIELFYVQFLQNGSCSRSFSQRKNPGVNPGDDLLAGFEPGAGNNLLPHGERSVGHEQETHGGHADFGALADIGGQTDQDRMDLLEFIL